MSTTKIICLIAAIVIVVCLAVYLALRILAKKGESKKQLQEDQIGELTLHYVKDWFAIEIGSHTDRNAAIIAAERIQDAMADILPDEVKEDPAHYVVLTASEKDEIYKTRLIHFETMDNALSEMLEKSNGTIKVGNK